MWGTSFLILTLIALPGFNVCKVKQCFTQWDGTITDCRQNVGSELFQCSLRSFASVRPKFEVPENLKDTVSISRRNFIELCEKLTLEDEKAFEDLWQRLGISLTGT